MVYDNPARLVGLWQQFQQANLSVQRLSDLMNAPTEPYSIIPSRPREGQGLIEIDGLSFFYAESAWMLLMIASNFENVKYKACRRRFFLACGNEPIRPPIHCHSRLSRLRMLHLSRRFPCHLKLLRWPYSNKLFQKSMHNRRCNALLPHSRPMECFQNSTDSLT